MRFELDEAMTDSREADWAGKIWAKKIWATDRLLDRSSSATHVFWES